MKPSMQKYMFGTLIMVAIFILLSVLLQSTLISVIEHNVPLNSLIILFIVVGIYTAIRNNFTLRKELGWIDALEKGRFEHIHTNPYILRPLANLLKDTNYSGLLTPTASQSLLVSIEERIEGTREFSRYLTGLLIFLGLLGTFWGLSRSMQSITGLINTLNIDHVQAFGALKDGLQGPLSGMGSAFSCSMLGLAGSLLLGCLDLIHGKASQSFFTYIEEKISHITSVGIRDEASGNGSAYTQSLLEQVVELTHKLHTQIRNGEENRSSLIKAITQLTGEMSGVINNMQTHQNIMKKIAQNQLDLQTHISTITKQNKHEESIEAIHKVAQHLDHMTSKVIEEMIEGRKQLTQELGQEVRLVSRTLSSLAQNDAA